MSHLEDKIKHWSFKPGQLTADEHEKIKTYLLHVQHKLFDQIAAGYCEKCEDTGAVEEICGHCNGSGEGMYDRSTCYWCHGKGVEYWYCDCEVGQLAAYNGDYNGPII